MATTPGEEIYEPNIYLFEETDVVQGGPDGVDNVPLNQLANRTRWLKRATEGYIGVRTYAANHALTAAEIANYFILINANSASLSFTLPDADLLYLGARATIQAVNVNQTQPKISGNGTDKIILAGTLTEAQSSIYLGNGDSVRLVLTASGWIVEDYRGNFDDIGGIIYRYKLMPNTIVANGQLLSRVAYPRLWAFVQTLGASLITDINWNSGNNFGFFSTGNGSTNFRVPDLRSMFIRGLDLGAGIDFGRGNENPGGYEVDDFKSHTHGMGTATQNLEWDDGGRHRDERVPGGDSTTATGGAETRPKNIGLLPLIKI
jgi:microcystin-dependent protein